MKRKSVCIFLFIVSLWKVEFASASENIPEQRLEEFRSDLQRLNGYLRAYEAFLCHELKQCNLLEAYYEESPIALFYFAHERILLPTLSGFNPEHYYKDYFKHAGQLLIRYFSKKSIKGMSIKRYWKVRMAALSLSLLYKEGELLQNLSEAEVEFLEVLNSTISPILGVHGEIVEPIVVLEAMISKDHNAELRF